MVRTATKEGCKDNANGGRFLSVSAVPDKDRESMGDHRDETMRAGMRVRTARIAQSDNNEDFTDRREGGEEEDWGQACQRRTG